MAKGKGAASRRGYIPEAYWNKRGLDYQPRPRQAEIDALVGMLRKLQPDSILDVGSGTGVIYNEMRGLGYARPYKMCDISDVLRARACLSTGVMPDKWDGKTLPYKRNSFDLLLSFHVFLHVLPDDLDRFLLEHVRVAKKYVYIASYAGSKAINSLHCFSHDYYELFGSYGLSIISEDRFNNGDIGHWVLKLRE